MKLRKHLRTKKLDKIEQLGIDRVIDLTFGKGESAYHILVELYASGNVILTDHEYTILSLLRSHKFEDDATIQVKAKYPFSHAANMTVDTITLDPELIKPMMVETEKVADASNEPKSKKNKKDDKITLKSVLIKMVPYASFPYAEHALRLTNADPGLKADPTSDS
jgi:predicted ribosome quality control (RQC) complex YloA/Tae2 family protein